MIDIYRQQAKGYDASGISALQPFRKKAVKRLDLRRGDLVVDVGCGTGLNFALVQEAIGPEGRIIGVDLTDAMLDQARQRVANNNWNNVDLVESDAGQYEFLGQVDGVLSTFALTFVPDSARVIQRGAQALGPGRRWVVLDMAWPAGWPLGLRRLLFMLPSYGITADVIQRRPWQTIWDAMEQNLVDVARQRFWLGFFYLASGSKPN
jgi:ubiquinone/menaquinone biosynthesis C-methylase UbiE